MTGFPTLIAEAGFTSGPNTGTYGLFSDAARGLFDTATWAPDDLWSDITRYMQAVTLRRGASRVDAPILRYEAGTSSATLNNSDRRFDPTNLSGPYVAAGVTQVTPMRAVRYRATWAAVTYDLWSGTADRWSLGYRQPRYSWVQLDATDGFKVLAAYSRQAGGAVGAGETTGARIGRILNSVGWPATDRIVAAGDSTVQATTLAGDALSELQVVADSELGDLFMGPAGHVVFRNRRAAITGPRSATPAAVFGDGDTTSTTDTTLNLMTNPSAEVTAADYLGGGFANPPTVTQSSTHALFGTKAVLGTWATGFAADLILVQCPTIIGLTPGKTYTFSAYVYVPTGSPTVFAVVAATAFGTSSGGLTDQWVRISCTTPVTGTAVLFQVWPTQDTTAGQQVWIDGVQVEEGATASAYCDGDQAGCQWDGAVHASTSRRLPELPYADLTVSYDDTQLANLVQIARVGGAVQTAQDTASQGAYLVHTFERDDLIVQADTDAANVAGWLNYQSKDPELRVETLVLKPQRDPNRLWPQALGRDIGDRIRVLLRPPGGGTITREVYIRGIAHDINLQKREWTTTWTLQSATKYAFATWDILGRFDTTAFAF